MFITVTCCEETAKKLFESFLYLHMMFHIYKLLQDILTSAPTTLCRPSESWPSKFQDFPVPCNKISRTKLIFQEFPDPRNFMNTIPRLSQRCGNPAKRYLSLFSHFCRAKHTHTHTHLTALFPGLPMWVGTRKVKPIWILLKQETVSGISWAICKSAPRSRQITTPALHNSVFLQSSTVCSNRRCIYAMHAVA